ncbi:hypothetical protein D3C71_1072930 [compost metagenome]
MQFGPARARQGQQLVEHMPCTQGILANAGDGLRPGGRIQFAAQSTGLQRNGGQGRAQFVRDFIGQPALAHHRRLLAVQQGVDRCDHGLELVPDMA